MTIAGLGCRRGAGVEDALHAIAAACATWGVVRLDALAVLPAKADEPGLAAAARRLGLPLRVVAPAADARLSTRSPASLAATGAGSASEAAALGALGLGARLLGPRLALGPVTCAIAVGEPS